MLIGCASPIDTRTATTAELRKRYVEDNRKIKEDDLGCMWGPYRWISHATEERKVTKERQAIDAELMNREG